MYYLQYTILLENYHKFEDLQYNRNIVYLCYYSMRIYY